ncbi:MAG TPA: GntR family transcriptional regulator [Propioniciclava sp.]|jgi:DNA-binding GntR family transcriptional regulator|uniref:GntR family transcriptional regulator n=1 Tax=Propioniciclava sp. TaxID=2038686 RepID=UPI002BF8ABED|nr:GntR family transcriptional regulator [Propioniciclava sp.]HRL48158.1 GntR family transcriptional regulator [Propioniciclava sp.]HRL79727.1 GntR family transcriptional regulator [Propioniciclava sp.]
MSVASPLVADLAKHLRSRILAGEYAPEAKVTESGLAAEYGVARPTVRSAIELLAGEGLLVRSPFAAVRVPAIPLSERDELVTVLRFTEDLALDRIRSQQPDVRELRQAASGSLHGMLATLVRVSGSPRLEPIHRRTTFELMLLTQQHPGELASPDDAAAHATMRSFADAVATERFPEASALLEQLQDLRDGGVRAGGRAASSRSRR